MASRKRNEYRKTSPKGGGDWVLSGKTHKRKPRKKKRRATSLVAYVDETVPKEEDRYAARQYTVGAAVMRKFQVKKFEDITRKRFKGEELKFHTGMFGKDIVNDISKLKPGLYSVTVEMPKEKMTPPEDKSVHRNSLYIVMKNVSDKEKHRDIHFIIDNNGKAKYGAVSEMVAVLASGREKKITFEIKKSVKDFGLQTNDHAVGAMGRLFSFGDRRYVKGMKAKRIDRTIISAEEAKKQFRKNLGRIEGRKEPYVSRTAGRRKGNNRTKRRRM